MQELERMTKLLEVRCKDKQLVDQIQQYHENGKKLKSCKDIEELVGSSVYAKLIKGFRF